MFFGKAMSEASQPANGGLISFNPTPAHHQASPPHHDSFSGNSRSLDELMILKPYFAGQPKSLSGIALRAFCLGIALASSAIAMVAVLFLTSSPAWRVPFFLFALSAFHFLEFWTTAEKNTLVASIGSFLLTANWPGYAIAHSAAFAECALVNLVFPERHWAPFGTGPLLLVVGLLMVTVGQYVRSVAMLQAGASFNHHVQTRKKDSHELVTTGIYSSDTQHMYRRASELSMRLYQADI
ncbi:Isoprenylcysteine carboxyl methyltransferase family-domain-containing protein [Fusarium acuminatum]|uniref:Protein-S-isoprenylcysteine O-methyltransferase n=1 Tax=Fusarium acuminatum TaxID=5515 RepID=A0ABZ2WUG4_9HYPO